MKPIDSLIKKNVIILAPDSVFIDPTVAPEKIAPGTVIHPFCRISGAETSIGPKCVLGAEGPVTIENCQLGAEVKLAGGYFSGATFLNNSRLGSGAHVRPGTLLEEFSSGAHAVGLKQTVLLPYVVLGSLINFCDCLMAGGTSRKNHSEVGSSYIHFNFTPHHDKATPSLIGDVPRGVRLDQPPVFLGGQGGLVGPVRVAFGAVIPAGIIQRKDVMNSGLVGDRSEDGPAQARPLQSNQFIPGAYRAIDRIIRNNLIYIGNIHALKMWYRHARKIFMTADRFQSACRTGALERLDIILQERLNRLNELAEKMPPSIKMNMQLHGRQAEPYLRQQKTFVNHWPKMQEALSQLELYEGAPAGRDILLAALDQQSGRGYPEAIAALDKKAKAAAAVWLQSIVDRAAGIWKAD